MAKQVDNRVVEMEFKNKDFEKAVAVTMKSLDDLNKKLDELNKVNMSGFEQMTQKMNNTNFDRLADSIDYIKSRFGLIGIAAQDLKEEIVSNLFEAAQSVGNVFGSIEQTIQEKGKARATNLAQAKFQLKGLGIEWNKVSESIDQAVMDTRFGLDEAAMAASQLAASGVALGDEMTHALLGISGVAAMTNSEYSDMAHIFTTVAGTGKLYTQQLNMIASRGLNAAAAIANYMTEMRGSLVTEADVRQMLSSKDDFIDFSTFAEAMWHEYGAQAKKGNDLFSGAFANAKAALGRIGEKFYTPFYEYARQTLVAVKPVINDLNAALTPFFTSLDKAMENTKNVAVHILGEIHKMFTGDDDGNDYSINLFGKTISAKNDFAKVVDWAKTIVEGFGATLNGSNGVMSIAGEALANIFYNLYEILISIGQAISDVFGAPSVNGIIYYLSVFRDWTEEVRLSDEQLESLKSTVRGITSALDILLKTGLSIYKVFIRPLLEYVGLVKDSVFDITGTIGDLLYNFDQDYDPFVGMYNTFHRLLEDLSPITNAIKFLLNAIKTGFTNLTGINSLEEFVNAIASVIDKLNVVDIIGSIFYGIGEAINFATQEFNAFKAVSEGESSFKEFLNSMVESSSLLSWIRDTVTKISTTIKDLVHGNITLSQALGLDKLKEQFAWLTPYIDEFKKHYRSIFDAYEGEEGKEGLPFIQEFGDKLKEAISKLKWEDIYGLIGASFYAYWQKKKAEFAQKMAESVNVFTDAFRNLTEGVNGSLVKMSKETNSEKILKIAAAVALLAGSVFLLSQVDNDQVMQAIGAIAIIMALLAGVVVLISQVTAATRKVETKTKQVDTNVRTKDRTRSKGKGRKKSVVNNIFELVAQRVTDIKEEVTETFKDMAGVPAMILAFAGAVALIVGSVTKLMKVVDKNNIKEFETVFGVVILMMVVLFGGVMLVLSEINWFLQQKGSKFDESILNNLAKIFLFMGIAVKLIMDSVAKLTLVAHYTSDSGAFGAAVGGIALLLAEMGVILWCLANLTTGKLKGKGGKKTGKVNTRALKSAGEAILMMAGAIALLTIPISAIAIVGHLTQHDGSLLGAVSSIAFLLIEMAAIAGAFMYLNSKFKGGEAAMLAGAASMAIMAFAINMLILPISAMAMLSAYSKNGELDAAVEIVEKMMLIMAIITAGFGAIGGVGGAAAIAGIIVGAAAMLAIAKSLQMVALALAGMVALEAKFPGGVAKFFTDLGQGLATLVAWKTIVGMYALAVAAVILGAGLLEGGAGLLMFGRGIKFASQGIFYFISALYMLQSIDFEKLGQNITNGGAAFIHGFVEAMKGGIPDIVDGFVAWIAAGAEALVMSSAMISEACLKLLVDVIVAIDNHSQELGFGLGHALLNIILYAVAGIFAAGVDFVGMLLGIEKGEGMTALLKHRLLEGKDSDQISEAEAKEMTMDFGHKLGKGLAANFVEGYKEAVKDKGTIGVWKKAINDTWSVQSLFTPSTLTGGAKGVATKAGFSLMGTVLSSVFGKTDEKEIKQITEEPAKKTAESIGENINSPENTDVIKDNTEKMLENGFEQVNKEDLLASIGIEGGNDILGGFTNSLDIQNGISMETYKDGEYIDAGLAEGMLKNGYSKEAAKKLISEGILDTIDKESDSASPSKEAIKRGGWIDSGLAIGLTKNGYSEVAVKEKTEDILGMFTTMASLSTETVSNSGLDALRDSIESVAQVANGDIDLNPTITPFLDLSNVNSGFASLSDMFSRNRSIALASDVSSLDSANRMLNLQIQNDNRNGLNNNIDSLGAKLDSLGESILSRQIVLDSGQLVGGLVNPMDQQLGVRAILAQRGG